jgi:predicted porin
MYDHTIKTLGDNLMKKALLPLLIASLLPVAAFAEVTVYGKANVSIQSADEGDEDQLEVVSNASRIGVKGGEEINSDLKVIYQFEYQTEVDDGANGSNNQTFGQRNIFVGLQGTGGTLIAGKFDTPTKAAQEKIDLFNDLEGDIAYLVKGETRANNIVQYTTPAAWGAFAANVAAVAAENSASDDGVAGSITYTTPSLYLAVAAEQDVTAQEMDILRVVGRYTIGGLQLGALYEEASYDGEFDDITAEVDSDAWFVSAKYNFTPEFALKAQYGDGGQDFDLLDLGIAESTGESISIGADYYLSKNATLFGYYTKESAEVESVEAFDDSWVGVGIDLKF